MKGEQKDLKLIKAIEILVRKIVSRKLYETP